MTNFCAALLAAIVTCMASALVSKRAVSMDEAQADFALNLLRTIASSNESAILSPFSIAVALSMTYVGAEGETKKQMAEVLAKGQDEKQLNKYFSSLLADMSNKVKGYTLGAANRLYIEKNFVLKEPYLKTIETDYAGQLRQVDFKQNVAVANEINAWVEQQTYDKIKDLLKSDDIDEGTRLMLVNAVYFKGTWQKQFKKSMTTKKPFYISANEQKQVEMMAMKDFFSYYEDSEVQVLGMPFSGDEVQMFFILPRQRFGLANLEQKLTGKKLLDYIQDTIEIEVQVEVPKFKMEKGFQLVDTLKKLGMTDAFSDVTANFSGISDAPLYISDVIHKAFIEVNEEGAEAAAASAIGMRLRSAPIPLSSVKIFHADHPYLFVITLNSNVLLFSGRMF